MITYMSCYFNVAAIPLLTTSSCIGTGIALVSNFVCTGHELNILDCRHTQISSYGCSYTSFVGVQCLGKSLYIPLKLIHLLDQCVYHS